MKKLSYVHAVGLNPTMISCENIRIYHGCLVWTEISVTRVTVRHHKACRVMPNSDTEGQSFLSTPNSHGSFVFLHTLPVFIAFGHFKCETFTNILTET